MAGMQTLTRPTTTALRYLADPENWLGDPHDQEATLHGHDTPFELAVMALTAPDDCPTCAANTTLTQAMKATIEAFDVALASLSLIALEDVGSASDEAESALKRVNQLIVGDASKAYRVPSHEK